MTTVPNAEKLRKARSFKSQKFLEKNTLTLAYESLSNSSRLSLPVLCLSRFAVDQSVREYPQVHRAGEGLN
jgi:hypothetical protein